MSKRKKKGGKTRGFVTRAVRGYALAIMFILLGAFIMGVVGYVASLVPEVNLTIGNISLSNRLFINFTAWITGILFILTALKKFGLPL
jgi:hypothetical protein